MTPLNLPFTMILVFIGLSGFALGNWTQRIGARQAMLTGAAVFGTGLALGALGIHTHQLWMLYVPLVTIRSRHPHTPAVDAVRQS